MMKIVRIILIFPTAFGRLNSFYIYVVESLYICYGKE